MNTVHWPKSVRNVKDKHATGSVNVSLHPSLCLTPPILSIHGQIELTDCLYVHYTGNMDISTATDIFDALSQETRLRAFRMLVEAGPAGLPAGTLSAALDIPHNTLSFHLNHLSNAGVVSSRREGRSVIYCASFDTIHNTIEFMVNDCCSAEMASMRKDGKTGCSVIELKDCCTPDNC